MASVKLLDLPPIFAVDVHQLLMKRKQQVLLDALGAELVGNPIAIDRVDVGREQQSGIPSIQKDR